MDLDLIRLNAHFNYVRPRITDKKKQKEFVEAFVAIASNNMEYFDDEENYNEGAKMLLDIWEKILQIHRDRFIDGRTGDILLEKL